MLGTTGGRKKILPIFSAISPGDNFSIGHFLSRCIKISTEDTGSIGQNSLGDYWSRKSRVDTGEQIKFDPLIQLAFSSRSSFLMVERSNIHIIEVNCAERAIYSNEHCPFFPVLENGIFVKR